MASIYKLYYKSVDEVENYPSSIYLTREVGIKEDKKSSKKGRNLSFIFKDDREKIDKINGLCTKRFNANIIIDGNMDISIGDIIVIDKAKIIVTSISKRCFEGCNIESILKSRCPLKNIFYGDVVEEGEIKINSKLKPISTD